MGILEISGISKKFGGLQALSNVNLAVAQGEIHGLIGTNGAGKTTLFNVICGFFKPDSGSVRFKGRDITGLPPEKICKIGIGRCFQTVQPFRSLTPMENARVARAFGGKSRERQELSLPRIMELVGLESQQDVVTEHLTLPDKKKVEIARALAGNPDLILFDEVASGLMGAEIEQRIALMKQLSDMGYTIIVVEHIIKFIKEICHQVCVMHTGEVLCQGSPMEVAADERVIEAYLGARNNGRS
jgi:branched-chain amino acid transport system ATP-binding protein